MIIYSNYFVEVHQVLHYVILFSKPLTLLTLFHQQYQGLIQKQKVDIDGEKSAQISIAAKNMVTVDDAELWLLGLSKLYPILIFHFFLIISILSI